MNTKERTESNWRDLKSQLHAEWEVFIMDGEACQTCKHVSYSPTFDCAAEEFIQCPVMQDIAQGLADNLSVIVMDKQL